MGVRYATGEEKGFPERKGHALAQPWRFSVALIAEGYPLSPKAEFHIRFSRYSQLLRCLKGVVQGLVLSELLRAVALDEVDLALAGDLRGPVDGHVAV